jgi:hypothetical protein
MKRLAIIAVCVFTACSPTPNRSSAIPSGQTAVATHSKTAEQMQIRSLLPAGSKIYRVAEIVVNSGNRSFVFPSSAAYRSTANGIVVQSAGKSRTFGLGSSVNVVEGGEWYQYPGRALPKSLRHATPAETVGGTRALTSEASPVACDSCDGSGSGGSSGEPTDSLPFTTDQLAGAMDSFGGDALNGFTASWDTPFTDFSFTYSYTLYDSQGHEVFVSDEINGGSVLGSSGGVTIDTSAQFGSFSRIQFRLTTHDSHGTFYTGNAHGHHP